MPPTMQKDPYDVLEVPRVASQEQIREAYRRLILQHHPDKSNPSNRVASSAKFLDIQEAHAVLSDPARKAAVDQQYLEMLDQRIIDAESELVKARGREYRDKQELDELKKENDRLKEENGDLRSRNQSLYESLRMEAAYFRDEIDHLKSVQKENEVLKETLREAGELLGKVATEQAKERHAQAIKEGVQRAFAEAGLRKSTRKDSKVTEQDAPAEGNTTRNPDSNHGSNAFV